MDKYERWRSTMDDYFANVTTEQLIADSADVGILISAKYNLPMPSTSTDIDLAASQTLANRLRDTLRPFVSLDTSTRLTRALQWLMCDICDGTVRGPLDAMVYRLLRRYVRDAELCDDATVSIVSIIEEAM